MSLGPPRQASPSAEWPSRPSSPRHAPPRSSASHVPCHEPRSSNVSSYESGSSNDSHWQPTHDSHWSPIQPPTPHDTKRSTKSSFQSLCRPDARATQYSSRPKPHEPSYQPPLQPSARVPGSSSRSRRSQTRSRPSSVMGGLRSFGSEGNRIFGITA